MKPAIVVAAYNRIVTLQRLLSSLLNAQYNDYTEINLIISIDKSDNHKVYNTADNFTWPFGVKTVIKHEEHLGLRKHIISCGDLTADFEAIILLEDDLYVSPYFYNYAVEALRFYQNDHNLAGISLYNYHYNERARLPFEPLADGSDVYFVQIASSWGQAWNKAQWHCFKKWYSATEHEITDEDKWKKYFIRYMVENNKYFVFPRISLTTNCGDAGAHHNKNTGLHHVPILLGEKKFKFTDLNSSFAVYDVYFELLPEKVKKLNQELNRFNLAVDLYGTKDHKKIDADYILTTQKVLNANIYYKFSFKPHELNVLAGGIKNKNEIKLTKKSDVAAKGGWFTRARQVYYYNPYISFKDIIMLTIVKILIRFPKLATKFKLL